MSSTAKNISATLIGFGLIGKTLKARIDAEAGWTIGRIVDRGRTLDGAGKKLETFDVKTAKVADLIPEKTDIAFLAIPTSDEGESAYRYIEHCIERKIPIVTCEKGALAHHHGKLEKYLPRIGYSATVGGGTRLLPYLRQRVSGDRAVVLHAVLNGTLNYIFDGMARASRTLGEVVSEAQRLGYAEPGAKNPIDVLNSEIKDTVMKTTILFNLVLKKNTLMHPRDITMRVLDEAGLSRLIREGLNRRYIVSFLPPNADADSDVIGGFDLMVDGWRILAGFQRINSNQLFQDWLPKDVNNSILTYEGPFGEDGIYMLTGPGAGPKPTTASMMTDAKMLLEHV